MGVFLGMPAPQPGGEWPTQEWVDQFLAREPGWQPTWFRRYVLKVHSRCDFACTYCYMYAGPDQSWRRRPRTMAGETIAAAARRIGEHAGAHDLDEVEVIFHGGEPLLAGVGTIEDVVAAVENEVSARVVFTMQTNGAHLTSEVLAALRRRGVRIGVSLDGDREAHDRHRRYAGGRASYDDVVRGLRLLSEEYAELYTGLLAVVDLRNDPVSTYEALLTWSPPSIDFLLPHGNWERKPPGRVEDSNAAPYGDWLIRAFDRWYGAPAVETRVRLFEEIIAGIFGSPSRTEAVGLSPAAVVVIETDGDLELADQLKTAYEGAPATGLNVFTHSLDAALKHPGTIARQVGVGALCDACLACPIHRVCGGGLYVHRFDPGNGFLNPSVYCRDLFRLIVHIRKRVRVDSWRLLGDGRAENAELTGQG